MAFLTDSDHMIHNLEGKMIVIEGIDGSGKQTQTEILCKTLSDQYGFNVEELHFPQYSDDSSLLVRNYLDGTYQNLNAQQVAELYAIDRLITFKENGILSNLITNPSYIVVCDRYVYSSIFHMAAKFLYDRTKINFNGDGNCSSLYYPEIGILTVKDILESNSIVEDAVINFLDYIYDIEFNLNGLPIPDLIISLNVNNEYSKTHFMREGEDVHESNNALMRIASRTYECWENIMMRSYSLRSEKEKLKFPTYNENTEFVPISCGSIVDGEYRLRSIEEISEHIMTNVNKSLKLNQLR